ncbi:type II toxin-antitoxin system RelE/ParE family toxin [Thalassospira lohafexi]|uniref:Plasmid stabilization protein n=1 Tax=Thalassospira lohafexi TaxID=744227 RepID=A0A2N3L319_9PROT|nr:plasmid stabilization protein [Thalassospira lohafexi]
MKRPLPLLITETAQNDLADIWAFIAEDNHDAATRLIHEIGERFDPLCQNPEMGPKRDELSPGLRVCIHRNYAIYYRIIPSGLVILRVLHGARDTTAQFDPK